MPSKGHKIAAKQSKLNSRRKRTKAPHQSLSPKLASAIPESTGIGNPDTDFSNSGPNKSIDNQRKSTESLPQKPIPQKHKPADTNIFTSNFLGGELRRIAILSMLMVVILVALTFVLN